MSGERETYFGDNIPIKVFYDENPFEPATRDYPGCEGYIDITSVELNGECILEYLSQKYINVLNERICEMLADEAEQW